MFRYLRSVVLQSAVVWVAGLSFGVLCVPVFADGVAVFASLTDPDATNKMRMRLAAELNVSIEDSEVVIHGTRWTRLHSGVMTEGAARDLIARAVSEGYSAWFNGTGDSLVTSSSAAATAVATRLTIMEPLVDRVSRSGEPIVQSGDPLEPRWRSKNDNDGVVTPATEDISHLPMAETFPMTDSDY